MSDQENEKGLFLYQWPEAKGVDSIYPRCVIFHRLFNLLGIKYSTYNVSLPFVSKDSSERLTQQLIDLPILKDDGILYKNSEDIISHIMNKVSDDPSKLKKATRLLRAKNYIYYQWANEVFLNTLLYSRWLRDCNFRNFMRHVNWGSASRTYFADSVNELKGKVESYMSRFAISKLSDSEYLELLHTQLKCLEDIFSVQKYILNDEAEISRSDLAIFMVIQGLLSRDLEESEIIIKTYPNIIRWAGDIDEKSSGIHTKSIELEL
ncbi:MAG: hypothetical protein VX341_08810 [Bdellovibrionota bacterium]|nr:hypothetical protein [Bdellovibrionota bacterium]